MKRCYKCKKTKEIAEFAKDKNNKDGLQNRCKSCAKEYRKANADKIKEYYKANADTIKEYYKANANKIKERGKEYRKANADKIKEYYKANANKIKERGKEYYKANADKIKEYYKANVEQFRAHVAKRRSKKLNATPDWLTAAQLEEMVDIYKQAKELEQIFFNRKFHVDHIIPLQGKDVCGLHIPWNLQILTAEENIKKGNRL